MERAAVIGGFGGQGILFAGQVLAQAALDEGRSVSWLPSYGPEMRGGTASCTVVISDRAIGSPIVDEAEVVIALNPPSLARFEPLLVPGGVLILNGSLIEAEPTRGDVEVVRVPCSAIAREAGDDRLVSIVALGTALARRPLVAQVSISRALVELGRKGGPELVQANLRALQAGIEQGAQASPAAMIRPGGGEADRSVLEPAR